MKASLLGSLSFLSTWWLDSKNKHLKRQEAEAAGFFRPRPENWHNVTSPYSTGQAATAPRFNLPLDTYYMQNILTPPKTSQKSHPCKSRPSINEALWVWLFLNNSVRVVHHHRNTMNYRDQLSSPLRTDTYSAHNGGTSKTKKPQ